MSFRVQEQHLSLHFVLPLYTYSDHLLFGFYAISYNIFFSPLPLATSSFHRHVSLCFGGPIVHPRTCSVAFCHTSFIAFHLLFILSASNTSSFLYVTNQANSGHWALSASILSALVCVLLPAGWREAANCRYCFYSQAKNQVFRPAGATRCTDSGQTLQDLRAPGSAWLCKISRLSVQRGGNAAPKMSKISTFW